MKTILQTLIILSCFNSVSGQITSARTVANFGVDADLGANFYNNAQTQAADDWFNNRTSGTGKGVIDTSGASALVAAYFTNPASRKFSFSRRMAFPAFTIVNNRLLLDAAYYRDYHGMDSTVFASGSNKNGMSPGNWTSPVAQSIPDKNDILEAMIHVRRAGPFVTDSLWLFAGVSLENITGNRFFDFELYQTNIAYDKSTGKFVGYGPDAGHTSWEFDAGGNIKKPGDVIFTSEFSSSAISLVEARIWVHKTALNIVPASFIWGGQFDGDGSGANYGYANIKPKTAGNFYTGLQTTVPLTWAGHFRVVRDNDAVVTDYIPGQYLEFSVNLSKLGIEPANYNGDACDAAFIKVVVKTRSSTSFTAELKDFVAPFKFFDYPAVEAYSYLTYYCGVMPEIDLSVINPNINSTYVWSTSNGNIVGSNVGPVIKINAPGTYYVNQKLNTNCPVSSTDSITIIFSPSCAVLDVNITSLQALVSNNYNYLSWTASFNEQAASYELEYSTNNKTFTSLGSLKAGDNTGNVNFAFRHLSKAISADVIFYRVKVTGKNGASNYSNVTILRTSNTTRKDALVFPNPTTGVLWLRYLATKKEIADVLIYNNQGSLEVNSKLVLNTGENLLKLPLLSGKAPGTYLVKIKTSSGVDIIQKILLL